MCIFRVKHGKMDFSLFNKYNVPGPRYTSYPTVPFWKSTPTQTEWFTISKERFKKEKELGISLYIHIPFCEELCTYCGCHKFISKNHSVEKPYVEALLKEWDIYLENVFQENPLIKELHLGGGTPTYLSNENMSALIKGIEEKARFSENIELSIEAHPNYTTEAQIKHLAALGFNRISFGIQDFDLKVQQAISRVQTVKQVTTATEAARKHGFQSINFDLIYGLPFQTEESIFYTFEEVNKLSPDRIAFYSYAHVPWMKTAQRLFSEEDLPGGEEKRALYEMGRLLLEKEGYLEVGMDHFAKKEDQLYRAFENGTLHRNFMGYTTNTTQLLVGLGCSSISDAGNAYLQNEKNWKVYMKAINENKLPITKGHLLTPAEMIIKNMILGIMCRFKTPIDEFVFQTEALSKLNEPLLDGLIDFKSGNLVVTPKGKPFVRNICMAFDPTLMHQNQGKKVFSSTV